MKFIPIISALLLLLMGVGCASNQLSEYEQGCYDGLDRWLKYAPETENLKLNTCAELAEKRKPRVQREFHGRDRL